MPWVSAKNKSARSLLESQARVPYDSWAGDETEEAAMSLAGFPFHLPVLIRHIFTEVCVGDL